MQLSESQFSVESHPIPPFFPRDAKLLFLGSFPPPKNRWCMDFFYPNLQNDFWRIFGLVFFQNREYFLSPRPGDGKMIFDRSRIESFLRSRKIALFDTALEIVREKGNASDAFLKVVTPIDLTSILKHDLPECQTLIVTGEKAAETLLGILTKNAQSPEISKPGVGQSVSFEFADRSMKLFRLPSSSRAYPMKLEKKAEIYGQILSEILKNQSAETF